MKRRIPKIIGFAVGILVVLSLLWVISVYLDLYPNSDRVQVAAPSIHHSDVNAFGRWRSCEHIDWRIDAQVETGNQTTFRQHYKERWRENPEPGGKFVNPTTYVFWDSYSMFSWAGKRYSVSAHKEVVYPESDTRPFTYTVVTKIAFCSREE